MQKIVPTLWFDNEAEQAAEFYTSTFKNSEITNITRYGKAGPGPERSVLTVTFRIEGQEFVALNGGPQFKFTEAISLLVNCESQDEVDDLWQKLTADGGEPSRCGWLKDKYGLSWQIVPTVLFEMISDPDPEKSERVMQALLQMIKLDINALKAAYEQPAAG
jgi:predicted 3-demethylubiquinone-9 3-methyltransferase (glyoxalase superfamily)